jgi:hypothetical protein
MVDRVEIEGGNGIRGRAKYLRSFRRGSGGEDRPGYDEPCAAEEADTGCRLMMRVGGLLHGSLPAAVGTPQGVDSALSGAGKQQKQRDHPSHKVHYAPNERVRWAARRDRATRRQSGGMAVAGGMNMPHGTVAVR